MSHQSNITRIKAVSNALGELKNQVVFVGGATISLYPDRKVFETRPTDDVDVIVEIMSYSQRAALEEKLRTNGFTHDVDSGILCRYKVQGIIVDVMPTSDASIGFHNQWYPEGFSEAIDYDIDPQHRIKILSGPYFIATKLEAFKGRGGNDGRMSQDFEDIIFVLENRSTIWNEMKNTKARLNEYLLEEFSKLADNPSIFEWIDAHVERGSPPASYTILEETKNFIKA
jgi:predicted nucleotidyltransferase